MLECLECKHHNEDKATKCANCGVQLFSMPVVDPRSTELLPNVKARQRDKVEKGSDKFKQGMVLNIHVQGDNRTIRIRPKDAILFGRRDPTLRVAPDIDLTEYDGMRKGISRVHAAMRLTDEYLVLIDMASSNGTFHNGERALPHHPRLIRDGDEVQLGELVMKVEFSQ